MSNKISCVLAVKNEEKIIKRCLDSIKDVVDEIIVVDDYSTDHTVNICRQYTDKIFKRELENNFGLQKNFGICKSSNEWVLLLDADEMLSSELKSRIGDLTNQNNFDAFSFIMRTYYGNEKVIKYGIYGMDLKIRLFRKNMFSYSGKVHEKPIINGETKNTDLHIIHKPTYNNFTFKTFYRKWMKYARIKGGEIYINKKLARENRFKNIVKYSMRGLIHFRNSFIGNLIKKRGYKDGYIGLKVSILLGMYYCLEQLYVVKNLISKD